MNDSLERIYDPSECVTFRKTSERFGGLSNMAPGFRVRVNGVILLTVEALYQACRYPHNPDLQSFIISQASPMTLKMRIKRHIEESRPDWDKVRVRIMRWCLRVKLAQNISKFGDLLLQTDYMPIVEDSRKDTFWGAMRSQSGYLVGANVLGRLLMELREDLRTLGPKRMGQVAPPDVPDLLMLGSPIAPIGDPLASHDADGLGTDVYFKLDPTFITDEWTRKLNQVLESVVASGSRFEARIELSCKGGCNKETLRNLQDVLAETGIQSHIRVKSSLHLAQNDHRGRRLLSDGTTVVRESSNNSLVKSTSSSSNERS